MALLPLYSRQPYAPGSAMTIAAISSLLGNILGGLGDWGERRQRKYEYEQEHEAEEEHRRHMEALQLAASKRAEDEAARAQTEHEAKYAPMDEDVWRGIEIGGEAEPVGPSRYEGNIPSWYQYGQMREAEAADLGGEVTRATLGKLLQEIETEKFKRTPEYFAMSRSPGGAGADPYLELGRFMGALGDLPEEFDRAMDLLDPDDPDSVAALNTIVDQMTMLAPHPEAIRTLDSRFTAATTQEEAAQIWNDFQSIPGIERGDELVGYKLYQFAMRTKPVAATVTEISDAGPSAPPWRQAGRDIYRGFELMSPVTWGREYHQYFGDPERQERFIERMGDLLKGLVGY